MDDSVTLCNENTEERSILMRKILVLGGTGLLGYYTIKELLKRSYEVKSAALPSTPGESLFASENVENILTNVKELSDDEVLELLADIDGVIYAIGTDERVIPEAPAFSFFYEEDVRPTQRIARLAAKVGVESFVIFGSYFAEFAEQMTDVDLMGQAYPATRLLQEQLGFAEGEGKMRVTSLRLPYVFGTMPGRIPLWKMFTDQIKDNEVYPVFKGGTAAVTVEQVAQAAVGALEKGEHRKTYAIGGINMKHTEFADIMVHALGQENMTEIPVLPLEAVIDRYKELDKKPAAEGKEYGAHMEVNAIMSSRDLFIDPTKAMAELEYAEDDVYAAIDETLSVVVKEY